MLGNRLRHWRRLGSSRNGPLEAQIARAPIDEANLNAQVPLPRRFDSSFSLSFIGPALAYPVKSSDIAGKNAASSTPQRGRPAPREFLSASLSARAAVTREARASAVSSASRPRLRRPTPPPYQCPNPAHRAASPGPICSDASTSSTCSPAHTAAASEPCSQSSPNRSPSGRSCSTSICPPRRRRENRRWHCRLGQELGRDSRALNSRVVVVRMPGTAALGTRHDPG